MFLLRVDSSCWEGDWSSPYQGDCENRGFAKETASTRSAGRHSGMAQRNRKRIWRRLSWVESRCRPGHGSQKVEFRSSLDGRSPAADPKLAVDVFGVGFVGIDGDEKLSGDLRSSQVGGQQVQHLEFAPA